LMRKEQAHHVRATLKSLHHLVDTDPVMAIEQARSLRTTEYLPQNEVDAIKSAIFIDAGNRLLDINIVSEGVDQIRPLAEAQPDRTDIRYNLANGLSTLAQITKLPIRQWYLKTSDYRREARLHFESVGQSKKAEFGTMARAKTNQANLLNQSFRWLEAYELYREAVRLDPKNVIASSGAVKVLLHAAGRKIGHSNILKALAARYLRLFHEHKDRLSEYGGSCAKKILDELPDSLDVSEDVHWPPDLSNVDDFTRFVANNNLSLSLTIEGLNPELCHWDCLSIPSIHEDINTPHGVPPIFAMFNVLKADYLAARWLTYQAIQNLARESGSYADTLDYALYGIRESIFTIAQRSAIDILDRIAVASSEYLELKGSPSSIHFWKRWHVNDGHKLKQPLEWEPVIRSEIDKGNTALIALAELAEDIAVGGYLHPKRTLRNESTHRFVIVHDMEVSGSRESQYVKHFGVEDFRKQTISALKLVRAALFYFIDMITIREARLEKEEGISVLLEVPPHHWIRGKDDVPRL
jgi:hypothetical protein